MLFVCGLYSIDCTQKAAMCAPKRHCKDPDELACGILVYKKKTAHVKIVLANTVFLILKHSKAQICELNSSKKEES